MTTPFKLSVKLDKAIPAFLVRDVTMKLVYVDELITRVRVTQDRQELSIDLREQPGAQRQETISKNLKRTVRSLSENTLEPILKIFDDNSDIQVPYKSDPMPTLLKQRQIIQEVDGAYSLGPLLSKLVSRFEKHLVDVAADLGASEYRFSALMSPQFLERINYFANFPHSLGFVTHLREDLDRIEEFSAGARATEDGLQMPVDSMSKPKAILSPTVCHHLYHFLADRPLEHDDLVATAFGHCFRYESRNMNALERLWNFSMREIVFVGSASHVMAGVADVRQRMTEYLKKIGLAFRVESATDPFFIGQFKTQAAFQSIYDLKQEVRALLPYKNGDVAIGSYNYHQDFFGRRMAISLSDGSHAHTGCVGFGLERVAIAFIAQYGTDSAKWPTSELSL